MWLWNKNIIRQKNKLHFRSYLACKEILIKLSDSSKLNLINLDTIKEISKANQSEREKNFADKAIR